MSFSFDRWHAALALLLGLGMGFRLVHRPRAEGRVDRRARAEAVAPRRAPRNAPRERRTRDSTSKRAAPGPRAELTPAGALPVDELRARGVRQDARPLLDLAIANEAELMALPGVGPALARRIVEDRASRGKFASLDDLQRVRGIGPGLARRLAPHVTFGGNGRPSDVMAGARRSDSYGTSPTPRSGRRSPPG
jgi:hypothetical protein